MPSDKFQPDLPGGRSGRVLALCLLGVVLMAILIGIVMPLIAAWQDLDEKYGALTVRAQDDERLVARKAAIAAQLTALRAEMAEALDYLPAAEPAMAAAQAQSDLTALVERSGAVVRSTSTNAPTISDGFTAIGFQLNVTGSIDALRALLYDIEGGRPRLIIDRLTLAPAQRSASGEDAADLDMSLDLHGYMIGEVAP